MTTQHATQALLYGSKAMNAEPINDMLPSVAIGLESGHPVIVELEPGDATYYNLLLVPAWGDYVAPHLGRYGIPGPVAGDSMTSGRETWAP